MGSLILASGYTRSFITKREAKGVVAVGDKEIADRIRRIRRVIVLCVLTSWIVFALSLWLSMTSGGNSQNVVIRDLVWFFIKLFVVLPVALWLVLKLWVFLDRPFSIEEWIGLARRIKTAFGRSMAAGYHTKPTGKSTKSDALRCENCGKAIPRFMTLKAWDGHVVCATCMQMLKESESNKGPRREKRGPIAPADSQK